jgi:polar amino acid transport system substrate-binding protein
MWTLRDCSANDSCVRKDTAAMGTAIKRCAPIVLLLISIVAPPAQAQRKPQDLRVGVMIAPPFVTEDGGALDGFSIELWNAVATQMKATTSYQLLPGVESLQEALRQKKLDAVVYPLVITLDRVEHFDCSVPILQVGLQVMVRSNGVPVVSPRPLEEELALIFSRTAFIWLGIALILVLVPAHLVWLPDRYEKDGIITRSAHIPGIFQAIYWALACLTTQAEKMPRQWLARIVAVFWMFTGVAFVASYTAQLTSRLTVSQFTNSIQGPGVCNAKKLSQFTALKMSHPWLVVSTLFGEILTV